MVAHHSKEATEATVAILHSLATSTSEIIHLTHNSQANLDTPVLAHMPMLPVPPAPRVLRVSAV